MEKVKEVYQEKASGKWGTPEHIQVTDLLRQAAKAWRQLGGGLQTGQRWGHTGGGGELVQLRGALDAYMEWLQIALSEAETETGKDLKIGQQGSVRRNYKDGWSPAMMRVVQSIRVLQKVVGMWKARRGMEAIRAETERWGQAGVAQVRVPRGNSVREWKQWVQELNKEAQELKKKVHGRNRTAMRVAMGKAVKQREAHREMGMVGHYLDRVLNRAPKGAPLSQLLVPNADGGCVLVTDKEEVAEELVDFFAKWMGKG